MGPRDDPRRYTLPTGAAAAQGGQGRVFRACRTADGRVVALKQLAGVSPAAWVAHRHRAAVIAEVDHPNLGRQLDTFLGSEPFAGVVPDPAEFDLPYTVLDWIEGVDLPAAAARADLGRVMAWVRDVAHAAGALHRHPTPSGIGIVHRDIKPSNVRITSRGAVLVDFGIARPVGGPDPAGGVGTPGWFPPEALTGADRADPRRDQWQLAGLASWAILGAPPGGLHPARVVDDLERQLRSRGLPRPGRLARHIAAGLATDPRARPAEVGAWGDELVSLTRPRPRPRRRRRRLPVAVAVALALSVASASTPHRPGRASPDPPPAAARPPGRGRRVRVTPVGPTTADTGQTLAVSVELAPGSPSATALGAIPLRGGRPVPGVRVAATPATGPVGDRSPVTLTVGLGEEAAATDAVVLVDALMVELVAADGSTTRTGPHALTLTFAGPVPGPERCDGYDPAALRVDRHDADWTVTDGRSIIGTLDDRVDAARALTIARQADRRCAIGIDDHAGYQTTYWRAGARLAVPRPLPAGTEDCTTYDPATVRVVHTETGPQVSAGDDVLLALDRDEDAGRAAAVARHHTQQCFIGRDTTRLPDPFRYTFAYWR